MGQYGLTCWESFFEDDELFDVHVNNLDRHFNIEFKWNGHAVEATADAIRKKMRFSTEVSEHGTKVKDVIDLIPGPTAVVTDSKKWRIKWRPIASSQTSHKPEFENAANKLHLTLLTSKAHGVNAIQTINPFFDNSIPSQKLDKVLVEMDTERLMQQAFGGDRLFDKDEQPEYWNKDMPYAARAGQFNTDVNQVIMADMPFTLATKRSLLFEPYAKDNTNDPKGKHNGKWISPVTHKKFYHNMLEVVRNMWMVWSINKIAAESPGSETKDTNILMPIGAAHFGSTGTRIHHKVLERYSMKTMLETKDVSLPFSFVKHGNDYYCKFRFDPRPLNEQKTKDNVKSDTAMSEYDNWMNDEYEFGYDDDADEDYFDDDADYDYYYDLLNYILSLFQ